MLSLDDDEQPQSPLLTEAARTDEKFSAQMVHLIERSRHDSGPPPPSPPCDLHVKDELSSPSAQCFCGVQIGCRVKKEVKEEPLSPPCSTAGHFFQPASPPRRIRHGKESTSSSPPRRSGSRWRPVKMDEAHGPIASVRGRLLHYLGHDGGDGSSSHNMTNADKEAAE